jgi:hypothetical protein
MSKEERGFAERRDFMPGASGRSSCGGTRPESGSARECAYVSAHIGHLRLSLGTPSLSTHHAVPWIHANLPPLCRVELRGFFDAIHK